MNVHGGVAKLCPIALQRLKSLHSPALPHTAGQNPAYSHDCLLLSINLWLAVGILGLIIFDT